MKLYSISLIVLLVITVTACNNTNSNITQVNDPQTVWDTTNAIVPVYVTDTVQYDTDDPAIWIDTAQPANSLIVGTDKDDDGALYVFDLNGKMMPGKTVKGLKRPNNVDIVNGVLLDGKKVDIAVTTERNTHKLRIFQLPDMIAVDGGGLPMFEGDTTKDFRDLMGIAMYKSPASGKLYAIVGRKSGPTNGGYLGQYLLEDNGNGQLKASPVRFFGKYSGKKEIESIAVDQEAGYVYYSDEQVGVRKYYAEPGKGNEELALFATTGFASDHEGISIYKLNATEGYILVSDQQRNCFHIFPREGYNGNPHAHPLLRVVKTSTDESDGSEVSSIAIPGLYPQGFFVAMSTNKTFQIYKWEDLAGKALKMAHE